nr:RxLR effector protein 69a [Phytophthora cinnamomi]
MKVTKVLAALCVALLATAAGSEGVADENRDVSSRRLRQEFAAKPGETGGVLKDSTNPLRRRDQALVSAHRVYDPASGLACSLVGDCVACPRSERDESFCRETGYRQELDCPRPKDPKDAALLALMTVVLVVSFVLLRRERGNHMSSFDLRKDPRQRAGLLGGGASSDKGSD